MGAGLAATTVSGLAITQNNHQDTQSVANELPPVKAQASNQFSFNQVVATLQREFRPAAPETIGSGSFSSTKFTHHPLPHPSIGQSIAFSKTLLSPQQAKPGNNRATTAPVPKHKSFPKGPLTVSMPEVWPIPSAPTVDLPQRNKDSLEPKKANPVPSTKSVVLPTEAIAETSSEQAITTSKNQASPSIAQLPSSKLNTASGSSKVHTVAIAEATTLISMAEQIEAIQEMVKGENSTRSIRASNVSASDSVVFEQIVSIQSLGSYDKKIERADDTSLASEYR